MRFSALSRAAKSRSLVIVSTEPDRNAIRAASLDASALGTYVDNANKVKSAGFAEFVMKIIPTTAIPASAIRKDSQ